MFDNVKVRLALIVGLVALSGWLLWDRGITLGLDLRGGTHLALEVRDEGVAMPEAQRADAIDRALTIIRTRVNELGVAEPSIQKVGDDRIVVELPGATAQEQARAKETIQQSAFLQFQIVAPAEELQAVLPRIDRVVEAELGDAFLAAAPEAGAQPGAAQGEAEVGGLFEAVEDTAAVEGAEPEAAASLTRPFSSLLLPNAPATERGDIPAVYAVALEDVERVQRALALPQVQQVLPRGTELRWGWESTAAEAETVPFRTLYLLESDPLITGEYLTDAQAQRDPQFGQPEVIFELSRRGGRVFERGTGANVGNLMAVTLDEEVYSAPVIQSQIGASGRITLGGGTIEEASDFALVLRAGALPAPIEIVEERSVGPTLGADSVEKGRVAGIIGIMLVILIMIGYYRFAGVMAVVALAIYLLLVLGGLASIDAALTLPGIAGIVLSIGMAVDANVLIFERIREELDAGRTPRVAVNEGFQHALSAIIDSQLTTLLTAAVLYQFGTGPVRGFAVTLSIGIVASVFTAIFITRTFFMLYLARRGAAQTVSI